VQKISAFDLAKAIERAFYREVEGPDCPETDRNDCRVSAQPLESDHFFTVPKAGLGATRVPMARLLLASALSP
jgi:hypothetical protein